MNKLNLTSKMLLWALFPIVCFAIAIAATKWYCDTVTPRELIQSNTPLNWQEITLEKLPAELKTQINPNQEHVYSVADASYSTPNLKKKIANENNANFKAYRYIVYVKKNNSWVRESQWIYYNNNGMWELESVPLVPSTPDFEATIINIVWFLSFGICLIATIISIISDQPDYMPLSAFTCFITGLPFIGWLVYDKSLSSLFSSANYPEWILVALIICEISIISLVSQIYQYQSKLVLDSSKRKDNTRTQEKLELEISILEQKLENEKHKLENEKHKSSEPIVEKNKLTLATGKFIQVVENNEEKERSEIIFFDDYLLIGANNKWDKFSYKTNNDNSIITIIDSDNKFKLIEVNNKIIAFPQLIFNGLKFTRNGKSLSKWEEERHIEQQIKLQEKKQEERFIYKEQLRTQIYNRIIPIYTKRNFVQKTWDFITRSTAFKEKESTITHIFDNVFEEIFNEVFEETLTKYSCIDKFRIGTRVTEVIKSKIEEHGFKQ